MTTWTSTAYLTPKHPKKPVYQPLGRHPRLLHLILLQIYLHRFMTSEQLFKLHQGNIPSGRQAREYMRRLRAAKLIDALPTRAQTYQPLHVHYVTPDGIELLNHLELKHNARLDARKEDIYRGGRTVETSGHELLVTDLQIFFETDPAISGMKLAVNERRYNRDDRQLAFNLNNKRHAIEPDLGLLFYGQKRYPLHFIELDNGSKNIPDLLEQVLAYFHWWDSDEGQNYLHKTYTMHGYDHPPTYARVLVVFQHHDPTDQDYRLEDFLTHVPEIPEALRRQLWLVEAHHLDHADLTEPLWLCPSEFTWLPEYEALRKKLPAGDKFRLQRHREELNFIRQKLANEQRLALIQGAPHGQRETQTPSPQQNQPTAGLHAQ